MISRHKTKKKYIRGYGTVKSGTGLFDTVGRIFSSGTKFISQNKETLKNIGEVGANTKKIVQQLRKPTIAHKNENDIVNIINRINDIKAGSGFQYV